MLVTKKQPNILRADPTRTATLRRTFEAQFAGRFERFKRNLIQLVVEENAFGLGQEPVPSYMITNTRWRFRSTSKQLELFAEWLKEAIAQEIIGRVEDAYWMKYIRDGYEKGAGRVFDEVRKRNWGPKEGDFYLGSKMEFLRSAFAQPVSVDRVKVLAGRVLTDLRGVNEDMATKISRTLTDGLVQGKNPRDVGRDLAKAVDVGKKRAQTIARTETIRAHAEGQLDGLENLGIEEVGVMVEWEITHDSRVCELCSALEGIVLKIKEARGLLPRHPNCRCAFLPANVGEKSKGQLRRKEAIQAAIKKSVSREHKKGSLAEKLKKSSWAGADKWKSVASNRPKSVLR